MKRALAASVVCWGLCIFTARAEEQSSMELLLPGGTLYSLAHRTYRSLRLPEGWTVAAAAYSPDAQSLALVLVGKGTPSKTEPAARRAPAGARAIVPVYGPVTKTVRPWRDSVRLLILDRLTGSPKRSSRLPDEAGTVDWEVSWSSAGVASALARHRGEPALTAKDQRSCPRLLAETYFQGKNERFLLEAAGCTTPPERSDVYRLVRENERTHKDAILWDYRVLADSATCSAPDACYSGNSVQFLSATDRLFLAWDGDVYALDETEDGVKGVLVTQLLPQYGHPWGLAAGETKLDSLDVENKVTFQPANESLALAHGENPVLVAQNFCPARSFEAAVAVGPYVKSIRVPAGYQMGPVEIGSFKERAYTPLLISVTWTAFHHIVKPVFCEQPYTMAPGTRGIVVSLSEGEAGALHCRVTFQEDR